MDALAYQLQLAGIANVIPEEQFDPTDFDVVLGSPHIPQPLSDPRERFQYQQALLEQYMANVPILPNPGTSLCDSCSRIRPETLSSEGGYIHSENWWALRASAEVSKCPFCVLLVRALRGKAPDFDNLAKLLNPLRTDCQISLELQKNDDANSAKKQLIVKILGNGDRVTANLLAFLKKGKCWQ